MSDDFDAPLEELRSLHGMRFIIDTHTFLWFIHGSSQLSSNAKNLLESDNDIWISIVSLWEIAIKVNIAKLTLPNSYEEFIPEQLALNDIEILPIRMLPKSNLYYVAFTSP